MDLRETNNIELQKLLKLQREINSLVELLIKKVKTCKESLEQKCILEKKLLYDKREELIGKIPKFWADSLRNALSISGVVFDINEVTCLDFLTRMSVENIPRAEICTTGTKVTFYFEENNALFKNRLVSKDTMFNDSGDVLSTSTTWKLTPPYRRNVQKTGNREKLRVFHWLDDIDEAFLDKQIRQLWKNPLKFYTFPGDPSESGYDDHVKWALKEIELYQQRIKYLNETSNQVVISKTKMEYETTFKILFNKRKVTIQKIPHFWATALKNHSKLLAILGEDDKEFLKYTKDLNFELSFDKDCMGFLCGFTVYLYLSALNPYVKNKVLSKTMLFSDDGELTTCKVIPAVWEKRSNCQEDEAKTSERHGLKLINWFREDTDTDYNKLVFSRIFDLWLNPLQYLIDVKNVIEADTETDFVPYKKARLE